MENKTWNLITFVGGFFIVLIGLVLDKFALVVIGIGLMFIVYQIS